MVRTPGAFKILTSKCASCQNSVHFFDISTSKSGPSMACFVHFDFEMCFVHNVVHFFDISTSKSGPSMVCFVHFGFEICFVHNGVHFFDISTSKSGPIMVCFAQFDFEMCFAPQRRALFRHVNFQKWSGHVVLWAF